MDSLDTVVNANQLFRPIPGAPGYGLKYFIWLLRQVANIDPYWKKILSRFLADGHLPKDVYEIITTTNKLHFVDSRRLHEIYDFDGETFQIFYCASRHYYEVYDTEEKSLFTGTNPDWLKTNVRQRVIEKKTEQILNRRRQMRQVLDFKKGCYFDDHEKEKIEALVCFNWPIERLKSEIGKLENEIRRLAKLPQVAK